MDCVNRLLGTTGVVYKTLIYEQRIRYEWHNPNVNVQQIDIDNHLCFFKQEWEQYVLKYQPSYTVELICSL